MKKYFGIIFAICILIFSILLIILPKKEFSENENRYLEEFPSFNLDTLLDGSFMTDLEKYVQDHFPFRNSFLNVKSNTELALGKTENNNVYIAENGYLIEKNTAIDEHRLDRIAMIINSISKEAKDFNLVVLPNLFNIQNKMILVFNKIIENLAGKSGFIRSSVLGSRLNFSCRTVNSYGSWI